VSHAAAGGDGVLIVDTMLAPMAPEVSAACPVDAIIEDLAAAAF
jgi:hypothetical protein